MAEAEAHCTRWAFPLGTMLLAHVALVQARFILPEEARLAAQFGDAYSAYRSTTRRWF